MTWLDGHPRVPPPPVKHAAAGEEVGEFEPTVTVIRRLDLEPGDALFVSVPGETTARAFDHFRAALKDALDGVKVIVLAGGAKVEGVVRRQPAVVLDENAGVPVGVPDAGWPPATGFEWDGENVYRDGRLIGALR